MGRSKVHPRDTGTKWRHLQHGPENHLGRLAEAHGQHCSSRHQSPHQSWRGWLGLWQGRWSPHRSLGRLLKACDQSQGPDDTSCAFLHELWCVFISSLYWKHTPRVLCTAGRWSTAPTWGWCRQLWWLPCHRSLSCLETLTFPRIKCTGSWKNNTPARMKQPRHDMQTPTQSKAMPRTAPEKECLKWEELYLISLKNPGSFPAFKWHQEEPGTSLHPRQSREELADQREAGIWNTLPTSVMEVRSFEEFRRKLDTFPNKGRLKNRGWVTMPGREGRGEGSHSLPSAWVAGRPEVVSLEAV